MLVYHIMIIMDTYLIVCNLSVVWVITPRSWYQSPVCQSPIINREVGGNRENGNVHELLTTINISPQNSTTRSPSVFFFTSWNVFIIPEGSSDQDHINTRSSSYENKHTCNSAIFNPYVCAAIYRWNKLWTIQRSGFSQGQAVWCRKWGPQEDSLGPAVSIFLLENQFVSKPPD